eukprot:CAMPEP_0176092508 /NCGR_PEP_ID=MMETSP0120_2-20121206/46348_1 /TAXON_ID=160619 /ORGANISM="Kryptoperidinium foliaceum, Strain CCMP 1326" /LENGTH=119 /DNA_ID=CAMNT_0017426429 /DNA_START=146 /DNA_END=502 /DNA_ORIENTATION=-
MRTTHSEADDEGHSAGRRTVTAEIREDMMGDREGWPNLSRHRRAYDVCLHDSATIGETDPSDEVMSGRPWGHVNSGRSSSTGAFSGVAVSRYQADKREANALFRQQLQEEAEMRAMEME